eukprot:gene3710-42217_t
MGYKNGAPADEPVPGDEVVPDFDPGGSDDPDLAAHSAAARSELTEGAGVVVIREFATNSAPPVVVSAGAHGTVMKVDSDGDVEVDFDGIDAVQWVFHAN